MPWLLLFGVIAAYWAGRAGPSPVVGSLGPGGLAPPARAVKRVGEKIRFVFGVPYQIVATTRALSSEERARLHALLSVGTWHARNISFGASSPGVTHISLCFVAPKTATVPIGQPLDWDLGDGRCRLVLREVRRLDGRSC
jgi:hypothetical protein